MYIGGYNNKPAYDIGATLKWNDFNFMFNTPQYSKRVPT